MTILQLPQRAGIPYYSMVATSTPLDRPNSALNSPAVEAVLGSEGAVSTAAVVPILRALGGTASTNQRALSPSGPFEAQSSLAVYYGRKSSSSGARFSYRKQLLSQNSITFPHSSNPKPSIGFKLSYSPSSASIHGLRMVSTTVGMRSP